MLFKLYCLPGKVLAHLHWLFPDTHMDAVRSARQRDSSFVHFLGSSSIYVMIAVLFWLANRPDAVPSSEAVSEDEQVVEMDAAPQELMPVIDDVVDESEHFSPAHSLSDSAAIIHGQGIVDDSQFSPLTPDESHPLSAAIVEALASGEATRWEDQGQAGYVVVSIADPTTSCRNYFYTIDTVNPNWQSQIVKTCN